MSWWGVTVRAYQQPWAPIASRRGACNEPVGCHCEWRSGSCWTTQLCLCCQVVCFGAGVVVCVPLLTAVLNRNDTMWLDGKSGVLHWEVNGF